MPLLAVYLPTATYTAVLSPDPRAAALPAWRLATHGDLDLTAHEGEVPWLVEVDGRLVSNRQPGVYLPAVPAYLVAGRDDGATIPPATATAVLLTTAAMVVLHLVFRRLVRPAAAVVGALVAGLATGTWSVSADALWPHGTNQLWLAAGLLAADAGRLWAVGSAHGLAILTRPNTAVVPLVVGLAEGWRARSLGPVVRVGLPAAAGLAALVAYNAVVFGAPSISGGYPAAFAENLVATGPLPWLERVAGTLFSPDRGVLALSPFLGVLVIGLPRAWRAAPPWVRAGALAGLVYLLLQLRMNRFSGGNNFYGYRYPLEPLTLAAPLLVLSWREWVARRPRARAALWALVGAAVAFHGLGATAFPLPFAERSPWRHCNLCEAAAAAGPALTAVWAGVALAIAAVGVRDARRAAAPSRAAATRRADGYGR